MISYVGGTGNDVVLTAINGAPVFTSSAAAIPNLAGGGQPVTFSAVAADPNGDVLVYSWNFGDGTTGMGATTTHSYASVGTYQATVTISDGALAAISTVSVIVVAPTIISAATVPHPGSVGQTVTFSSVADHPNPDVLMYSWSFGDGTNGVGATTTHSYSAAGTYPATVTVSDGTLAAISTVSVLVTAPLVGGGADVDDDDFSDEFETYRKPSQPMR